MAIIIPARNIISRSVLQPSYNKIAKIAVPYYSMFLKKVEYLPGEIDPDINLNEQLETRYELDFSDHLVVFNDASQEKSIYGVESSFWVQNDQAYSYISTSQAYLSGKEVLSVTCSVGNYYSDFGELVIADDIEKTWIGFSLGDRVIPMFLDENGNEFPSGSLTEDRKKEYLVTGVKTVYDGEIAQKLILHEIYSVSSVSVSERTLTITPISYNIEGDTLSISVDDDAWYEAKEESWLNMQNNISKVIVNGETVVDLTDTTAMPEDVKLGKKYHGSDASLQTGTNDFAASVDIPVYDGEISVFG